MRKNVTLKLVLCLLLISSIPLFAQSQGDYRTRDSGDWGKAQIWERFNGASWVAVGTPPTGSETITILADDSVFVDVAVPITDTLINQGIVEANDNLSIGDGGIYKHDRDAGKIPIATWDEGSTLLITGVMSTAPEDRDQDYYHVIFNNPVLARNLNMNLDDNTIYGDIRVINTGLYRWQLTSADPQDTSVITIMGDVFVEDGSFTVQGTSNAQTTFIVHHYGNIEVTGGNFSVSRGSQGGGTTTWYIYEGNLSMSNATTQSSTATPGGARFVFAKQGTQTLTLGEGNTLTALPIEVSSGTTLDMGSSILAGSGIVDVKEGATVLTSLAGGVDAIFAGVTTDVTLADGSGYGFNGTEAQITSTRMPATVTDLIIDNSAGVKLSQATTINGVLRLVAGVFDNTISFTLGDNGSISYEGGSLLIPTSVARQPSDIPAEFALLQNYPNPFNPMTTIRYTLPRQAQVTLRIYDATGRQVAELVNGQHPAGAYAITWNAEGYSSGAYYYRISAGEFTAVRKLILMK